MHFCERDVLVLDVDGTLTDGKMFYSKEGKIYKAFGCDDWNALDLLQKYVDVHVVSADQKGFWITQRRVEEECGYDLTLVPGGAARWRWIHDNFKKNDRDVFYMGDGIEDSIPLMCCDYGITTLDALPHVKKSAKYVTRRPGGNRAVADACLHILHKFYHLPPWFQGIYEDQ